MLETKESKFLKRGPEESIKFNELPEGRILQSGSDVQKTKTWKRKSLRIPNRTIFLTYLQTSFNKLDEKSGTDFITLLNLLNEFD